MKLKEILKRKMTITLTVKEFTNLSNVFHSAQYSDVDFTKIRNRKVRKLFSDSILERHKLWLKIQKEIRKQGLA